MRIPDVVVIVINYKTSHLIQGLIDSINEEGMDISFLVVDNASTQESFNQLQLIRDPRVHILTSEENLGFTGGINYALRYILKNQQGLKYFFLLNPDAFSSFNLVSNLLHILKENENAACISPKIIDINGKPGYSGGHIEYNKGNVSATIDIQTEKAQPFYEIDAFSGCAALFDLDKVLEVGMFNEDLFMYYDEADISIKLKKSGYKILYTPYSFVHHDTSYTTRNISHLKTYYMTRNKFIVFSESMTIGNKCYFLLHELAFHLKNRRVKNAVYHLKGFYDYVVGKKGACQ
jgi:GT2 family glycosyltransferase